MMKEINNSSELANLVLEKIDNNTLTFKFVNSILQMFPDSKYNLFMTFRNIETLSSLKNGIKKLSNNELYLKDKTKILNNIYYACRNITYDDLFYGFKLGNESREFMNKLGMYDVLDYYQKAYDLVMKEYDNLGENEKNTVNINEIKTKDELVNEINSMITENILMLGIGTIEKTRKEDNERIAYATRLMTIKEISDLYQKINNKFESYFGDPEKISRNGDSGYITSDVSRKFCELYDLENKQPVKK